VSVPLSLGTWVDERFDAVEPTSVGALELRLDGAAPSLARLDDVDDLADLVERCDRRETLRRMLPTAEAICSVLPGVTRVARIWSFLILRLYSWTYRTKATMTAAQRRP